VLTLEGEVVVDVEAQPHRLSFGQLSKRAEVTRELTLKVPEPDRIKITSVTIDDDHFALKLKSGDATGNATYEVTFKGSDQMGALKSNVRVVFRGSEVDHIDVPLWGQIVGDLRYPATLAFYRQGERFQDRKLTVTSRTKQPVHVLSAEDKDGHLKTEVLEAKGDAAVLNLSVAESTPTSGGIVRGTLVLKTTDRDEPEVRIKYSIHPTGRLGAMRQSMRASHSKKPPPPAASTPVP
jgi:hypothetical protein